MNRVVFDRCDSQYFIFIPIGQRDKLESIIYDTLSPATIVYNTLVEVTDTNSKLRSIVIGRIKDLSYKSNVGNTVLRKCGSLDYKSLIPVADNVIHYALNRGYTILTFKQIGNPLYDCVCKVIHTELNKLVESELDTLITTVVGLYANSSL